jgi:hypothetical protein
MNNMSAVKALVHHELFIGINGINGSKLFCGT